MYKNIFFRVCDGPDFSFRGDLHYGDKINFNIK